MSPAARRQSEASNTSQPAPDHLKLVSGGEELTEEEYLEHIAEFAEGLSDAELMCRRMGQHDFKPYTAQVNAKSLAIVEVMRCRRCKTKRTQDMTPRGMVVKSNYNHPPGYLDKGHGRVTGPARGILRVSSVMRGSIVWVDEEGNPTKAPSQATLKKAFRGRVTRG